MERARIFITGMGAVTPLGIGVSDYWAALSAGRSGISPLTGPEAEAIPVPKAGQVRDFDSRAYLPTRLTQDLSPFMQYAFVAGEEALRQSGLPDDSRRVGVLMASALGGVVLVGETQGKFLLSGRTASPKFLTKSMANLCAAQFAIAHGFRGPSYTLETACSSGGDAVTLAVLLLRAGAADAMVVLGGEAAICPTVTQSLVKTGALSRSGESRPFDRNRDGFVLGEGGGALVLETMASAEARGAETLGEVLGCSNTNDAFNPVCPEPGGEGAADCMRLALADAGLSPADIGYVNAHGTATAMGDIAEADALQAVFGAYKVPVSSTKGATGHLMGAGGLTELIACAMALRTGILPPNLGFTEPDPACDLNIVTPENRKWEIRAALSNAMGFGGQNSSVILGRTEP